MSPWYFAGHRVLSNTAGGRVSIRCAHGDVVSYALADVSMEIEGQRIQVDAGVEPYLPVPVLLGVDVPKLAILLRCQGASEATQPVMLVTTPA